MLDLVFVLLSQNTAGYVYDATVLFQVLQGLLENLLLSSLLVSEPFHRELHLDVGVAAEGACTRAGDIQY